MRKKTRSRRAGGLTESINEFGTTLSTGASNLWNKTKQGASDTYSYVTGTTPTYSTSTTTSYTPTSSYTQGGRRKTRKGRKMHGGYSALAYNAEPVSGIKTAAPQNWVGGRTRRRRRSSHRKRRHISKR